MNSRRQLPTFGSRRLVREFDLLLSHGVLENLSGTLTASFTAAAGSISASRIWPPSKPLPPVFLDYYLNDQGEYDVPRHP